MTKTLDWKLRREHVFPGRADYTKRRLREIGITRIIEEGYVLIIEHRGRKIRYSPFTGGYTGKGVKSGKGLENLIRELS